MKKYVTAKIEFVSLMTEDVMSISALPGAFDGDIDLIDEME